MDRFSYWKCVWVQLKYGLVMLCVVYKEIYNKKLVWINYEKRLWKTKERINFNFIIKTNIL